MTGRSPAPVWPKRRAYFWETAPMARPLLPFLVGILTYDRQWLAPSKAEGVLAWLATSGLTLILLLMVLRRPLWLRIATLCSTAIFFFTVGLSLSYYHDDRNAPSHYTHTMQPAEAYLARIDGLPQEKQNIWKQEVKLLRATDSMHQWKVTGRAYLNVYKNDSTHVFSYGDTVVIPARWQDINNTGNPFEFDYVTFSRRKHIYHQIFMAASSRHVVGKAQPKGLTWLEQGHGFAVGQLRRYLPNDTSFGLLQAMLMGDERDFDPELRQAYSDTGVVHIVSISGSHTAVLFMLVAGLFFWLRHPRWQWVKYATGMAMVWIYVLMAGAPPSALRSAVMFSMFALGFVLGRQHQPLNTLLVAAFTLLCAEPGFLFAVGFQLSFVAVLSLILFFQPIARLWPWANTMPYMRRVWQVIAGSLAAELLTAPLVVYYFHNFPVLFILGNIASVVLVGLVALVGGMAILAFCWLPPVATAIGWIVDVCVWLFNKIIVGLQAATPAAARHLVLSLPDLLLVYAIIGLLAAAGLRRQRQFVLPALVCAVLLVASRGVSEYHALQQRRLVVYNTNKQLKIELFEGKRHFLIAGDADSAGRNRMITQAHDGYYAWRSGTWSQSPALVMAKKRIGILTHPVALDSLPEVSPEVLILADSVEHFTLTQLYHAFRPEQLVVTGRQRRYLVKRWADSARILGIPLHATMLHGAWILEE